MAARGWEGGSVRPPLRDLDAQERAELATIMRGVLEGVPASSESVASSA